MTQRPDIVVAEMSFRLNERLEALAESERKMGWKKIATYYGIVAVLSLGLFPILLYLEISVFYSLLVTASVTFVIVASVIAGILVMELNGESTLQRMQSGRLRIHTVANRFGNPKEWSVDVSHYTFLYVESEMAGVNSAGGYRMKAYLANDAGEKEEVLSASPEFADLFPAKFAKLVEFTGLPVRKDYY